MAINTTTATLQMRRGNEADFDPDKMMPSEWAVSLDSKYVRMCFSPGLCIRMATYEGFEEDMKEIQKILAECQDISVAVQRFASLAEEHSKESESWAHGGTGTREGEDTDNSEYYSNLSRIAKEAAEKARDEAQAATGVTIATIENVGVMKPDGTTTTVDLDGTLHAAGGADVDIATTEKAGIVKPDGTTSHVGDDGTLSVPGAKLDFYGAFADFPEVGDPDIFYIDDTVDPRLMYTWDPETSTYILTGGSGAGGSPSTDISITLPATGWTGTTGPCSQTVTVPQMREGMTPILFLTENADPDMLYAYGLITDYTASYGQMTFYAADLPSVDISVTLKGVPAQQLEYVDNTVIVLVSASGFALNEDYGRYTQTITVDGMTAGLGGNWDIVRSGPVLTLEESDIVRNITDINRTDGAVEIVCLTPPEQDYMLYFQGTQTPVNDDTPILAGMQGWFDRVEQLEDKQAETVLWENPNPTASFAPQTIILSSDDYDYYEMYYKQNASNNRMMCQKAQKGFGFYLSYCGVSGSETAAYRRMAEFASDTSININRGEIATGSLGNIYNNDICIPVRIVGYKS